MFSPLVARRAGAGPADAMTADGSMPDAGPRNWCAGSMAAFCADFDEAHAPNEGWTTTSAITAGADLGFDSMHFTSPPRSLRSKVDSGTGPNTASAFLTKTIATAARHAVFDFDVRVDSVGQSSDTAYLQVGRVVRNDGGGVALSIANDGTWFTVLAAGNGVVACQLPAPPALRKFTRITLDIVWDATSGSVLVSLDGVTVIARRGVATSIDAPTTSVSGSVGALDASGNTPPADLSIDDVTLRLQDH